MENLREAMDQLLAAKSILTKLPLEKQREIEQIAVEFKPRLAKVLSEVGRLAGEDFLKKNPGPATKEKYDALLSAIAQRIANHESEAEHLSWYKLLGEMYFKARDSLKETVLSDKEIESVGGYICTKTFKEVNEAEAARRHSGLTRVRDGVLPYNIGAEAGRRSYQELVLKDAKPLDLEKILGKGPKKPQERGDRNSIDDGKSK